MINFCFEFQQKMTTLSEFGLPSYHAGPWAHPPKLPFIHLENKVYEIPSYSDNVAVMNNRMSGPPWTGLEQDVIRVSGKIWNLFRSCKGCCSHAATCREDRKELNFWITRILTFSMDTTKGCIRQLRWRFGRWNERQVWEPLQGE